MKGQVRAVERVIAMGLVCLTIGALVVGACGDSSAPGGNGPGGSGGSGGNGEPGFGESECGACVLDACLDEIDACTSDPGCTSYMECLLACPVDVQGNAELACDEACVTSDSTETSNAIADVRICRQSDEGAECAACGVPTLETDPVHTQECEPKEAPTVCRQCFFDECCDTWDACFDGQNPDCDALVDCLQACPDYPFEGCVTACLADHPKSVLTYIDQFRCALLQCATDQGASCDASTRTECLACQIEDCEQPLNELIKTEAGYLSWLCLDDCSHAEGGSTPPCVEGCFDDHPAAQTELSAYFECISYLCTPKCVPE